MALNPEDPGHGFRHHKVLTFVNKQIARHASGPQFYFENLSLSWEEVEDKLRLILEDSTVPSEVQEACAWGSLALSVRFACRQGNLQGHRVQWLHNFATMHRSAARVLALDMQQLIDQQELERKEAAFHLRLTQIKLAEMQRERDLMRIKLLHTELKLRDSPVAGEPTMSSTFADAEETKTQGAGEKEEVVASATGKSKGQTATYASSAADTAREADLDESVMQDFEALEWENYSLALQEKGNISSTDRAKFTLSEPLDLRTTDASESINIQLPASFTYSYESPFPISPTPSPTPNTVKEPQKPSYFMNSYMNLLSDEVVYGAHPQESPKEKIDHEPQQQRQTALHRPEDWACPWCRAVNFSYRKNCFLCGQGIWLQNL